MPGQPHDDRHGARQPERFDPRKAGVLEDRARFEHVAPAEVEALLALPEGGLLVDFGTGTGLYARELSRRRPDARVVALDEQPRMLEALRERLAQDPAPNVEPLLAAPEALRRLERRADAVLALNVLHELGDEALRGLVRLLKPGARAVFIDWRADVERPAGPPPGHVYSPEEGRRRVESLGLRLEPEKLLRWHYVVVGIGR